MEVILLKDIPTLGYKDEVVKVKAGYARNYLIPQSMAMTATPGNLKSLNERKRQQTLKFEKMMTELKALAKSLKQKPVKIGAKVGGNGRIFGSVTPIQISEAIQKAHGMDVDRRKIRIIEEVKTVGTYTASIELHRELVEEIKFEVEED